MRLALTLFALSFLAACGDKDEDTGSDTAVDEEVEEVDSGDAVDDTGDVGE